MTELTEELASITVNTEPAETFRVLSVWRENGVWYRIVGYGRDAPIVGYNGAYGWSSEGTFAPDDAFQP